ncbi:hypothetical protein PINS_up008572 [Pythium insidiosum]|nr:hypothetical protein PINS_up008572 [Pythium insidiosum]
MSDREKGLDSALKEVLPEVPHSYCSFHLKKNVVTAFKTDLGGNIHNIAKALTKHERQQLYDACKRIPSAATEYLQGMYPMSNPYSALAL